MAPTIATWIKQRLEAGRMVGAGGGEKPLPPYSEGYAKLRAKLGFPTTPDYTLTGSLLSHMSGRVTPLDEDSLEVRVAPWGRVATLPKSDRTRNPTGEQKAGYYWRSEYKTRRGTTVHGQWIRDHRGIRIQKFKPVVYNAHLMNRLSRRLGLGKWLTAEPQATTLMRITSAELETIRGKVGTAAQDAGAKALKEFVGL